MARLMAGWATKRYRQPFEETYSDAMYGLAVATMNCDNLVTFPGYANASIRGAILKGIRTRTGNRSFYERGTGQFVRLVGISEHYVDPSNPVREAERHELWDKVNGLSPRSSLLLRLYYEWELSQHEIAQLFNLSQMHISRLLESARMELSHELIGYAVTVAPDPLKKLELPVETQSRYVDRKKRRRDGRFDDYHSTRRPSSPYRRWRKWMAYDLT
jgi:RNA polymerase sigma factor (sigma-70 family)